MLLEQLSHGEPADSNTLIEKFWRISLYVVTEDVIAKLYNVT